MPSPVILPARRGQAAHDLVTHHLPHLTPVLHSIATISPQDTWLAQQTRANTAAHRLLNDGPSSKGALRFSTHVAAVLAWTVTLRDLTDAVVHALQGTAEAEGRKILETDQDAALSAVLYVVGMPLLDPLVYRRAVAPMEQLGADLPVHPAEWPDGITPTLEHARGVAFRAGYRAATHGEPCVDRDANQKHPKAPEEYTIGHRAATHDQKPA